jgi:hypothetical protein
MNSKETYLGGTQRQEKDPPGVAGFTLMHSPGSMKPERISVPALQLRPVNRFTVLPAADVT